MIQLPQQPESANVRVLAQRYRERLTGIAGVTLTLQQEPARTADGVGLELLVKNGVVLDPSAAYSIAGRVITLAVAAIVGDVFQVHYFYRA